MPKGKRRRLREVRLPAVFLDEHLPSDIAEIFREFGFRVTKTNQSARFKGRDERDYLPELRRLNAIFVTADEHFANWLEEQGESHPGLLWLQSGLTVDTQAAVARVAAFYFEGACKTSRFALRNRIYYGAYDGLNVREKRANVLLFSWDWLWGGPADNPVVVRRGH